MNKLALILIPMSMFLLGCSEPRVPAPKGLRVPEGTPLTINQYQSEIEHARVDAENRQKSEEVKAAREIRKIERATKNATDSTIADAQDRVDEINDSIRASAMDRQASLDALADSLQQAKLDIENRQAFVVKAFQAVNTVASSGLIPGGELLLPLIALAGTAFGIRKNGELKQAKRDHENSVDAIDHAADVIPELKHALERAKPIISEWQTPTSKKAEEAYRHGAKS